MSAVSRTLVEFDPNVRVRGQLTYVLFEGATAPLRVGEWVNLIEPESGLQGEGQVIEVVLEQCLAYLSVDWASIGP